MFNAVRVWRFHVYSVIVAHLRGVYRLLITLPVFVKRGNHHSLFREFRTAQRRLVGDVHVQWPRLGFAETYRNYRVYLFSVERVSWRT